MSHQSSQAGFSLNGRCKDAGGPYTPGPRQDIPIESKVLHLRHQRLKQMSIKKSHSVLVGMEKNTVTMSGQNLQS